MSHLLRDDVPPQQYNTPRGDIPTSRRGTDPPGTDHLWDEADTRFQSNISAYSMRSNMSRASSNSLESDFDGLIQRGFDKPSEYDMLSPTPTNTSPDSSYATERWGRETVGTGTPWRPPLGGAHPAISSAEGEDNTINHHFVAKVSHSSLGLGREYSSLSL